MSVFGSPQWLSKTLIRTQTPFITRSRTQSLDTDRHEGKHAGVGLGSDGTQGSDTSMGIHSCREASITTVNSSEPLRYSVGIGKQQPKKIIQVVGQVNDLGYANKYLAALTGPD